MQALQVVIGIKCSDWGNAFHSGYVKWVSYMTIVNESTIKCYVHDCVQNDIQGDGILMDALKKIIDENN